MLVSCNDPCMTIVGTTTMEIDDSQWIVFEYAEEVDETKVTQ